MCGVCGVCGVRGVGVCSIVDCVPVGAWSSVRAPEEGVEHGGGEGGLEATCHERISKIFANVD